VLAPGAKDQLQSDILWKAVCNKESNFKERLLQLQPKEDEATKLPALQALSRSRSEGAQTWRARAVQSDACTQTTVYAEKVMRIPEVRVLNGHAGAGQSSCRPSCGRAPRSLLSQTCQAGAAAVQER
ncbi:unnamed protein product, partial [Polarella glacialis]